MARRVSASSRNRASKDIIKRGSLPVHFWHQNESKEMPAATADGHKSADVQDNSHILEEALDQGSTLIEHGLMQLDHKANIIGIIVDKSEGQDKIFKFVTGATRVVIYWMKSVLAAWKVAGLAASWKYGFLSDLLERATASRKATSVSRKFLKLFNVMVFTRLVVRVYRLEEFGPLKVVVLARLCGLWLYFVMNYAVWACKVGILRKPSGWFTRVGLVGYLFSIVFTLALDARRFQKNRMLRNRLLSELKDRRVEETSTNENLSASFLAVSNKASVLLVRELKEQEVMGRSLLLNTFKNVVDAMGASSFLFDFGWTEQTNGILQITSACIGLKRMWRRTELAIKNGSIKERGLL